MVILEDFLTKEQLAEIKKYRKDMKKNGIQPFDMKYINGLKDVFRKWSKQLLEKGIFPDYLAYMVSYADSQDMV